MGGRGRRGEVRGSAPGAGPDCGVPGLAAGTRARLRLPAHGCGAGAPSRWPGSCGGGPDPISVLYALGLLALPCAGVRSLSRRPVTINGSRALSPQSGHCSAVPSCQPWALTARRPVAGLGSGTAVCGLQCTALTLLRAHAWLALRLHVCALLPAPRRAQNHSAAPAAQPRHSCACTAPAGSDGSWGYFKIKKKKKKVFCLGT